MGSQSAVQTFYFRRGWIYALTLALVTINYMDRAALGVVRRTGGPWRVWPVAGADGLSVLVFFVDLCDNDLSFADRRHAGSVHRAQHQLGRYCAVVAGDGGDGRRLELRTGLGSSITAQPSMLPACINRSESDAPRTGRSDGRQGRCHDRVRSQNASFWPARHGRLCLLDGPKTTGFA